MSLGDIERVIKALRLEQEEAKKDLERSTLELLAVKGTVRGFQEKIDNIDDIVHFLELNRSTVLRRMREGDLLSSKKEDEDG